MTLSAKHNRRTYFVLLLVAGVAFAAVWQFRRAQERERLTDRMVDILTTGRVLKDSEYAVVIDLVKRGAYPNARISWSDTERSRPPFWSHFFQLILGRSGQSDGDGLPVVMQAVLDGRVDLVATLLDHGAEVNTSADYPVGGQYLGGQRSALFLAAMFGRAQIVDLLLSHRADPNVRDTQKRTPLIFAVQVLSDFYEYDADNQMMPRTETIGVAWATAEEEPRIDNAKNDEETSQDRMEANYLHIVQSLLSHGADVNAKDQKGNTALSYVRGRKGNRKLEEMLRHAGAR